MARRQTEMDMLRRTGGLGSACIATGTTKETENPLIYEALWVTKLCAFEVPVAYLSRSLARLRHGRISDDGLSRPKNLGPDQRVPVIAKATMDRLA